MVFLNINFITEDVAQRYKYETMIVAFSWIRLILAYLFFILAVICAVNYQITIYLIYQGRGQLGVLLNTQSISDYSQQNNLSIQEKENCLLIEKIKAYLTNPNDAALTSDPLYVLSNDLTAHIGKRSDELMKAQNDFGASFRLLVEGLRESKIGTTLYPDANSTLRLTYGKVRSLPADKRNDAKVNNYTTLDGQVKKYKKGDLEFDLPVRVLEMNAKKEFGRYADKDGSLHVCFLTDNDITGGNSGSPVLNGKGELIGLAFDGNIEAMAGDVIFDNKLQRTINVDIRYVLWVIENFSGAKHIVDEMTLVKYPQKKQLQNPT
jgi:hypothetical protein